MYYNRKVRMLDRNEKVLISKVATFSRHSIERIEQRSDYSLDEVRDKVKKSILGYINTDGSINIAFGDYECLVIAPNEDFSRFNVLTYKERTNITMVQKYLLALQGIDRVEK